jgi:hypothetical protein
MSDVDAVLLGAAGTSVMRMWLQFGLLGMR